MHDVGKIGIRDEILLKPGKLTVEEFEMMKQHTIIGADIIGKNPSPVLKMAREIAIGHHEKWDGTGYPTGLKGEDIPIESRIAAIADVYDALTSSRPYKKPWSEEDALNYIKDNAGSHFDPKLVALFVDILDDVVILRRKYPDPD